MDLVDKIMDFEDGNMDQEDVVNFFQELIDSGDVWHLQGMYQRVAVDLIKQGLCTQPK